MIRTIFLIIVTFAFSSVNSQEGTSSAVKKLSEIELLKKAKSLRNLDKQLSVKLANQALSITRSNNNNYIRAKTHVLLGEMAENSNHIEESLYHFLQASIAYESINDKENQITYSIKYIEVLMSKENYDQAYNFIDELLPVALQFDDELSIALTFIAKANGYYQQKRYQEAIEQYTKSIHYLSSDNKTIKKHLGRTYKLIAQSYKRLKNREKTAFFYKKALAVYTVLKNKKLMARTLNTLAEAERYLGNLVRALDYSTRGLKIHKEIDDPEGFVKALVGAGIIYRNIGRYEKSLAHINEAHVYYKKINNINGIAEASNQLGFIYTQLKQFDLAKSFYQLSIDLSQKIKKGTLAPAYREMAVIELYDRNYKSALQLAEKAYDIYQKENDKSRSSITTRIIADIYRAQNYDTQAIEYYKISLSLAEAGNSKIHQVKTLNHYGRILIDIDIDKAIVLLKRALNLSILINEKYQQLSAYRELRRAKKKQGNVVESLRYAEKEISLLTIIQKEREDNEVTLAKANLYSYKMELELESLREEAKLDQLTLDQKNNEIEIANQTRKITELELIKNKYANTTLVLLLTACVLLILFIYRQFSVSKKRNRELDYLAARDPLTNCYNRRVLFDRMNQYFKQSELLDEYCIIMADIDHFKSINDTYGHSVGDSVICEVASILQGCIRQNDIVARFGGEEFCIFLPRITQNQAMNIAEIMRKKIEEAYINETAITCSFGVASMKSNVELPSVLIEQADLALYKSKSLGRNQVTLWDQTFRKKAN